MSTTDPNAHAANGNDSGPQLAGMDDPALPLVNDWQIARYVSLLLCRVQQRLESRMMVNTGNCGLTADLRNQAESRAVQTVVDTGAYAVAREAEVFAMTEALKLQDSIPEVAATSLFGVIAKLEMIVGADRDIGDPTDFPWPHLASVLHDLKRIAGDLPGGRRSRARTRTDVAKHWDSAAKLVAALKEESMAELRGHIGGH